VAIYENAKRLLNIILYEPKILRIYDEIYQAGLTSSFALLNELPSQTYSTFHHIYVGKSAT